MNLGSSALLLANILFFISSIPMMQTILGEWKHLKGYDMKGSLMILIANGFVLMYLSTVGEWISFVMSIPQIAIWSAVCYSLYLQGERL
jgi:hypothetical protein